MLLGVLFGQLTKRVPTTDGGMYAYARHEFGDFAGYLTAWCYWITCWAGNAAIVASWVLYVESLFGIDNPSNWTNFGIALTGLWIPAAINLAGVRQMAWFQNVTVVLKFLPLLLVGTFGWFFVESANFGPFNASGGSLYDAVNMAAAVALFSFIGVECASIAAGRVKDPRRNVGKASVYGTAASGLLYVAVTAAVMGLVPHDELVDDGTPFVAAFKPCSTAPAGPVRRRPRRRHLRHRCAQRLDHGHRRDAVRRGQGWPVPPGLRQGEPQRVPVVRHRRLDHRRLGPDGVELQRRDRAQGVHLPRLPVGRHRGHPVLLLGLRPAGLPGLGAGARCRVGRSPGTCASRSSGSCSRCGSPSPPGYQSVYQAMFLLLLGIPLYAFLKARRERLGLGRRAGRVR